ncbi:hypothetical protein ACIHJG_22535 [Streptomyces sp. NPDC052415]|uniref:hypothetical protein n=1 Tax=Streptomyces sp. NPDC052415 TaxID=3365690 RepID=UPI0037D309E7
MSAPAKGAARHCSATVTRRHDDQRDPFIGGVYALHGRCTLRYASRLLGGDWYLAEDILQEAVLRASTVLATLDVSVPDPSDRLLRG